MSAEQADQQIEFHMSGDWTGVYLGGKLVTYGHHDKACEWLMDHVGVIVVESDAWLSGTSAPLGTLEEVAAEVKRLRQLRQEAQAKRELADQLMREAGSLDQRAGRPSS